MALYEELFVDKLKVSKAFLLAHAEIIREKLNLAADEFKRFHGNVFAINMCLHVASSIILGHPDNLKQTLADIKGIAGLQEKDPSAILTVVALYYLVQWDAGRVALEKAIAEETGNRPAVQKAEEYEAKLKELCGGFDAIRWMIGDEAMRVLGF